MALHETLSSIWSAIQGELFPWLDDCIGPLTERHRQIVTVLELVRLESFLPHWSGLPGRPPAERVALARAFVAKAVLNLPTTSALIERLQADKILRRLCGYTRPWQVPSESTFSRAFAEFASSAMPSRVHEVLIAKKLGQQLIGHISRDSTAIEAPEKPTKAAKPADTGKPSPAEISEPPDGASAAPPQNRRQGRPRKGEEQPKEQRRLERQRGMSLEEMLNDLPAACDTGTKKNAKGYKESWTGYKLHMDIADGCIPISCILTSASLHDSQTAIPLATMTSARVINLYDLMDAAYDASEIKEHSESLGHIPIIDINPRGQKKKEELALERKRLDLVGHKMAEDIRYNERTTAERANSRIKEEFGGKTITVRGNQKVMCHLMFGVLALTVSQLLNLVT